MNFAMKSILIKNWFTLILSFLGVFPPAPATHEALPLPQRTSQAHVSHFVPAHRPVTPSAPASYTCIFEGRATSSGLPVADAKVLLRVIGPGRHESQHFTTTEADGTYSYLVHVQGTPTSPINWTLVAESPERRIVQVSGRVRLQNEPTITVGSHVDFHSN